MDLKSLFSGQQFSFLAEERETSRKSVGEEEEGERADVKELVSTVEGSNEERECLFFHWSNPDLTNRPDCAFYSSKQKQELERGWLTKRSAMRQLLRESHRQAVRAARHGKRRRVWTSSELVGKTSHND